MPPRIEQGKGAKDRYSMLSPVLLQWLRVRFLRLGEADRLIEALPTHMKPIAESAR